MEIGTYIAKERTLKVLVIRRLEAFNRMLQSDIIPIQTVAEKHDYIVADNADPAAIREWANNGYNIDSCRKRVKVKGAATNQAGVYLKTYVDFLRSFDSIIIDTNCHDIAYGDFSTIRYKNNKVTGAMMFEVDKLVCPDGDYDAFDSVKYALEVLFRSNNSMVFTKDNVAGVGPDKPAHNEFIKGRRGKRI